jgi:hypothetical protein
VRCPAGCRWLATAIRFGVTSRNDFYSPRVAESLVKLLPFAPVGAAVVGAAVVGDRRLGHQPGGLTLDSAVGWIEEAWATGDGVDAVIHLVDAAVRIRHTLLRLEHVHALSSLGVSLVGSAGAYEMRGDGRRVFFSVAAVDSLDFVTRPANPGCHVRRRLPCPGVA